MLMNINVDFPSFQVVLVGQPELRGILEQPDMRQFAQRIVVEHHLRALDGEETGQYIQHRLQVAGGDPALFDTEACELIHQHSRGVPRLINSLCDTVLEYGYEEQRASIDGVLVRDILNDHVNGQLLALAEPHYISTAEPTLHGESGPPLTVDIGGLRLMDDIGDRRLSERAKSRTPVSRQAQGEPPGNLDDALKALADFLD